MFPATETEAEAVVKRTTVLDRSSFRVSDRRIVMVEESEKEETKEAPPPQDDDSSDSEVQSEDNEQDEIAARRNVAVARAALLSKKQGAKAGRTSPREEKNTSVGQRRVGSATQARRGARATSQIMDAIRKTAQGTAAGTENEKDDDTTTSAKLTASAIHATIEDLLRTRAGGPPDFKSTFQHDKLTAAFSSFGRSIGVLGESKENVILQSDTVKVRVASFMDDVDIAKLRLSVFSDFSQDLQSQFCARSCQAIASRRTRGATCVVAACQRSNVIFGSAEFSHHEFFGTRLGQRRPQRSILYVTEVAVSPSARRKGIGSLLLQAIDEIADKGSAETLYLHVDVANAGAIELYKKAGYRQVLSDDPMYMEFTTSLNLHPGATKGRDHFLFYKNLVPEPTWLPPDLTITVENKTELVGSLGFEIPA